MFACGLRHNVARRRRAKEQTVHPACTYNVNNKNAAVQRTVMDNGRASKNYMLWWYNRRTQYGIVARPPWLQWKRRQRRTAVVVRVRVNVNQQMGMQYVASAYAGGGRYAAQKRRTTRTPEGIQPQWGNNHMKNRAVALKVTRLRARAGRRHARKAACCKAKAHTGVRFKPPQ